MQFFTVYHPKHIPACPHTHTIRKGPHITTATEPLFQFNLLNIFQLSLYY